MQADNCVALWRDTGVQSRLNWTIMLQEKAMNGREAARAVRLMNRSDLNSGCISDQLINLWPKFIKIVNSSVLNREDGNTFVDTYDCWLL